MFNAKYDLSDFESVAGLTIGSKADFNLDLNNFDKTDLISGLLTTKIDKNYLNK